MNTASTPMSKTAAIREASTYGQICGSGTSFVVYGPYRASEPSGPSTERRATSYPAALRIRTSIRASIALSLMGRLDDGTECEIEMLLSEPYSSVGYDLRSVVTHAATAFGRYVY